MTVADAIQKAFKKLKAAGIDDSMRQAKVLVSHVIAAKPGQLYFHNNLSLNLKQHDNLYALLKQRISGIPLQHVIGEWDFYGRTFKVDRRALIPRPETELLVGFITSTALPHKPLIVDVGTGSGIIGISLALEISGSRVTGTDISPAAIELAQENKFLLGAENYSTVCCNLVEALNEKFDVLVANLPYISSNEIPTLHSEVKDHDPVQALDGGVNGTLLILELIESAPDIIKSGGLVVLETGYDQKDSVPSLFPENLWANIRTHKDLAGNHRMVTARRL